MAHVEMQGQRSENVGGAGESSVAGAKSLVNSSGQFRVFCKQGVALRLIEDSLLKYKVGAR